MLPHQSSTISLQHAGYDVMLATKNPGLKTKEHIPAQGQQQGHSTAKAPIFSICLACSCSNDFSETNLIGSLPLQCPLLPAG